MVFLPSLLLGFFQEHQLPAAIHQCFDLAARADIVFQEPGVLYGACSKDLLEIGYSGAIGD
jgi:hypothetical protein